MDVGLFGASTLGDPFGAPRLADDHVRIRLFRARHRLNDRANPDQLAVVEVDARWQSAGEHPPEGQLVHQILERTHLLDHRDLLEEVVEREFARQHAGGILLGLLFVYDFFEVLHQANDIAHAEDAAGHALGPKLDELVDGFTDTCEENWRAGDFEHADRRTAAGITVELGQDDAGELQLLVEVLRRLDRVLTDHGVDDQIDVLGRDRALDGSELLHQLVIDGESSGGVVDDDVALESLGLGLGGGADVDRRLVGDVENRDVDLLGQHPELLHSGRSLHVGGDEERLLLLLVP